MDINKAGFVYMPHIDGECAECITNVMPIGSLNYMIGAALTGTTQFTSFYLGLFDANYQPVIGDDMASLIANCEENQSYSNGARQLINFPAVSEAVLTTSASPNIFTFSADQVIRGAFISTVPTWGNTSGLLVSAVLFPSPKTPGVDQDLKVPVGFGLTSV